MKGGSSEGSFHSLVSTFAKDR